MVESENIIRYHSVAKGGWLSSNRNGYASTRHWLSFGERNMFDPENAIIRWRDELISAGITSSEVLAELESHLRDDISRQRQAGIDTSVAFAAGVRRIGYPQLLKQEFSQIGAPALVSRRIAAVSAILFVASFFLPAVSGFRPGTSETGFWCFRAAASAPFWWSPSQNWSDLFKCFCYVCLGWSNFLFVLLVGWLYFATGFHRARTWVSVIPTLLIVSFFALEQWQGLEIGAYFWLGSYFGLSLAHWLALRENATMPGAQQIASG